MKNYIVVLKQINKKFCFWEVYFMKIKFFILLFVLIGSIAFAATMSVQIQQGKVRATPSQLGSVVDTVGYGEVIDVGELQKGWYSVTTKNGKKGWLHESALSKKPIKMRAGTTDTATGVSSDEVALAGKGFNEQVENKLKTDGTLDYTWVDRMIAYNCNPDQILAFRTQGHLQGGEK
jgi:uncharacterized protein YgiM (DUF1202 family)